MTKTARQALITQLIESQEIRSQADLAWHLAGHDIEVTQPTLSKDLIAVGAVRAGGKYELAEHEPQRLGWEKLARHCEELLISAAGSGNVAIIKTPPGAAQFLASALDRVGWDEVMGTIAGDDTIAVYASVADGGPTIANRLRALSERRSDD